MSIIMSVTLHARPGENSCNISSMTATPQARRPLGGTRRSRLGKFSPKVERRRNISPPRTANSVKCAVLRTAKVNEAQQLHIPVVSVRWLEECAKFWRLYPLEPFFVDFAQDEKQTCIVGKREIDQYHQMAMSTADTTLFTVTEAPPAYNALTRREESAPALDDFDQQILEEIQNSEFQEKRVRMSPPVAPPRTQFSPSIRLPIPTPVVVPFTQGVFR